MLHLWNCERFPTPDYANLSGFSGGLSHFACLRSRRALFDVGEGVATRLEPEIPRLRHVFVSHLHDDHLLGLRGLALARWAWAAASAPRLEIHVPATSFDAIRDDLARFATWRAFDWESASRLLPMSPGDVVEIAENLIVEAFDADHLPHGASLGFRLSERRRRLRERWRGRSSQELAALRETIADEEIHEPFDAVEFVYSGDTPLVPLEFARGAKVLWHEATFIDALHRDPEIGRHAELREVVALAKQADVESLILTHVSRRYREADVLSAIDAALRDLAFDRPAFWLRGGHNLPVD